MDKKYFYPGKLATRYDLAQGQATPKPSTRHGVMMKLGRVAPNMGHSSRPHLALYPDGSPNGPTGYGGGSIWPPQDFVWGEDIPWLRRFCSYDYYNVSGTSVAMREWHATYTPGEDALIQGVNQGFPTAVTFAIGTVLEDILKLHGAVPDMPMGANAPGTYVSGEVWSEERGCGATQDTRMLPRWQALTRSCDRLNATTVPQAGPVPYFQASADAGGLGSSQGLATDQGAPPTARKWLMELG